MGAMLQELGDVETARAAYAKAVALSPANGHFHRQLAECKRFKEGDPHLTTIEMLLEAAEPLSSEDRLELHFAAGKAFADLGNHERAFQHLLKGNALKRRGLVHDATAAIKEFQRIQAAYTPELIRSKLGLGHPSPVPIFIVGMPRSGTTLIEQILASHPKVYGAGERKDFPPPYARRRRRRAQVTALSGEHLRGSAPRYVERIAAVAPQAPRITDKLPGNFSSLGLIHLALPNARIIHARRDPIDTCLSCFSHLFSAISSPSPTISASSAVITAPMRR